jgi:hypothetical protein
MTYDQDKSMSSGQAPKPSVISTVSILLCLAALVMGCGNVATITRKSQTVPSEGKITRSDAVMVYVQKRPDSDEYGIDRSDIVDIDHPGNVAAVIGGVVAAYGVANIQVGVPEYCHGYQEDDGAACVGVFLPAVIGGSVMVYGLAVWARSVISAIPTSAPPNASRVTVVPIASVDKTNQFYGASARVSF